MSDTQKLPGETAPASTEVPAADPAPEVSAVDTAEAETAPAAEPTEVPSEQPKEEPPKEELKEITEGGLLGYKAPGLVKSFRFSKRYFYFSEEAVEIKQLSAVAHPIAAWASQTGKGLLFFTKRAEDKGTPIGIFNLSDISDISKEGSNEFIFKVNGQRYAFQASSTTERESWIVALEAKSTVAKTERETITSSEGYKAELEKLTKPPVVAAAESSPKKSVEKSKEAVKKDESGLAADDKSRSQSRKRASIFGSILGKKDVEEKKEEPSAETVPETPAEAVTTTEPPAEDSTTAEGSEEVKKSEAPVPKTKRASIFGSIFQKVTSQNHEKPEKEPIKETTVSSTAPQLENPVDESASKPIEPESVTAPVEAETAAPTEPASSSKGLLSKKDDATEPKEKRRPSLFGSLGTKKEKKAEVPEGELAEGEAKPKRKLSIFSKSSRAARASEAKKDKEAVATTETVPEDVKPEPISKDAPVEEKPTENAEVTGKAKEPEVPVEPVNIASSSVPVQAAA